MNNVAQNDEKSIIGAIKIDKKEVQEHMDKLVRESVEEVLNKLLNAEADAICNASRYEHTGQDIDVQTLSPQFGDLLQLSMPHSPLIREMLAFGKMSGKKK